MPNEFSQEILLIACNLITKMGSTHLSLDRKVIFGTALLHKNDRDDKSIIHNLDKMINNSFVVILGEERQSSLGLKAVRPEEITSSVM